MSSFGSSSGGSGGFGFGGGGGGGGHGQSSFGSQPQQHSGGGGFGNPSAAPAPFGGGFGSSPAQPTTFGSAPAPSTFGSSPFGGSNSGASTSFGASPNMATGGFGIGVGVGVGVGKPSNENSSVGFGGSTQTGFGSNPGFQGSSFASTPSSGFGSSSAFGSNSTNNGNFNSNSASNSNSGFGGMTSPSFGGNQQQNTAGFGSTPSPAPFGNASHSMAANPFGTSPSPPNTSLSFGSSANVVTTSTATSLFGAPTTTWGAPTSGQTGSNSFPFSNQAQSGNANDDGMQQQSDNEDMDDPTLSPFGSAKFAGAASNTMRVQSANLSPVNEEAAMADSMSPPRNNPFGDTSGKKDDESRLKAKMEEKRRLQAMIEEKKRKLLERQMKRNTPKEPTTLNADAASFVPATAADNSLAERNAARFSRHTKADTPKTEPADGQAQGGREALENAVSLVGTCQFMCPDDELQRRQSESDIQQLEIPSPGVLHPTGWTLRNTAVKRFRRSAADYKLDVPEWVRPPDVLEKVCSYLEEWVMDRDRQGPDPRFPQGQTPPSLDVYQFIWDRTRMIRKDLTLQNYVGTGGKCDARAVRCHERIARWHAMCEHQLSHIPDFVTMQSQQNIQELGQTMKTLNHFYDDALRRSTIEVPDNNGKETRSTLTGLSHGCTSDTVQGNDPTDFDGSALNNAENSPFISARLIGKHAINDPARGTAEPEMRGLYILLIMNNEGGMEVLKYAAKLFQERPEVYHSKPVQLALTIYKAKKEYNYARFFAILRAASTPYLFSCIMFKHVEHMRKVAFRVMSKTFGARKRDTGEAMYDAYPLNRLVELLCFESVDEALSACKHYNITVKQVKTSSSPNDPSRNGTTYVIFWRHSDFAEQKHEEKGTAIPLQPMKMIRTIEKKLNGATRLAVCRGEVSGEGASLQTSRNDQGRRELSEEERKAAEERKKAVELLMKQKMENAKLEEKRMQDELQRRREEQEKQEAERQQREQKRLEEEKTRKEYEARREAEIEKKRREEEEKKREMERLEQQRLEAEDRRRREEKARIAEEAQRRKEAEEKRRIMEEEEKRKKAEAAELARKQESERRQKEQQRLREEKERRLKEEAERRRREEEAARLEMLRRQAEERRLKIEEERRKALEWKNRIDSARKILIWRRWRKVVARRLEMTRRSTESLQNIDPTFSKGAQLSSFVQQAFSETSSMSQPSAAESASVRGIVERLVRKSDTKFNLADLAMEEIMSSHQDLGDMDHSFISRDNQKLTMLLKVAIIMPEPTVASEESICDLVSAWIHSRVECDKVFTRQGLEWKRCHEIRTVIVRSHGLRSCQDCDVALFVIPPPWSQAIEQVYSIVDSDIPCALLLLSEETESMVVEDVNQVLAAGGRARNVSIVYPSSLSEESFEGALLAALQAVVKVFVLEIGVAIHRIPLLRLSAIFIRNALWKGSQIAENCDGSEVLKVARSALAAMVSEIENLRLSNESKWSAWPPHEFVEDNHIKNYFSDCTDLPVDWKQYLSRAYIESEMVELLQLLKGSFRDIVAGLLSGAPIAVIEEIEVMLDQRQYRRSLDRALLWREEFHNRNQPSTYLYYPSGMLNVIIQKTMECNGDEQAQTLELNDNVDPVVVIVDDDDEDPQTDNNSHGDKSKTEDASRRPQGMEMTASEVLSKKSKRSWTDIDGASSSVPMASDQIQSVDKKQRHDSIIHISRDQKQSSEFTRKLEKYLHGDTIDLPIGKANLSDLLRGAPKMGNMI